VAVGSTIDVQTYFLVFLLLLLAVNLRFRGRLFRRGLTARARRPVAVTVLFAAFALPTIAPIVEPIDAATVVRIPSSVCRFP
jgi:hypothetical protein